MIEKMRIMEVITLLLTILLLIYLVVSKISINLFQGGGKRYEMGLFQEIFWATKIMPK